MLRVAPRDIFNEANFLNNLAQLVEAVESGRVRGVDVTDFDWCRRDTFVDDPDNYEWILAPGVIDIQAAGDGGRLVRTINTRYRWPMRLVNDDWDEWDVFNDDGSISEGFSRLVEGSPAIEPCVTSQELRSAANFMKCFGAVALNSIPGVNEEWPGYGFDEDAFMDTRWGVERTQRHWVLQGDLVTRDGAALQMRAPRQSADNHSWPLEAKLVTERDFKPLFSPDGARLDASDGRRPVRSSFPRLG